MRRLRKVALKTRIEWKVHATPCLSKVMFVPIKFLMMSPPKACSNRGKTDFQLSKKLCECRLCWKTRRLDEKCDLHRQGFRKTCHYHDNANLFQCRFGAVAWGFICSFYSKAALTHIRSSPQLRIHEVLTMQKLPPFIKRVHFNYRRGNFQVS